MTDAFNAVPDDIEFQTLLAEQYSKYETARCNNAKDHGKYLDTQPGGVRVPYAARRDEYDAMRAGYLDPVWLFRWDGVVVAVRDGIGHVLDSSEPYRFPATRDALMETFKQFAMSSDEARLEPQTVHVPDCMAYALCCFSRNEAGGDIVDDFRDRGLPDRLFGAALVKHAPRFKLENSMYGFSWRYEGTTRSLP